MTTNYAPVRTRQRRRRGPGGADWSLLSPQGRVLFYVAVCPGCSVAEIAIALGLTERSVWSIIRSLRRSQMVRFTRVGRRHRYTVNLDAPMPLPTTHGVTLRSVLGRLTHDLRNGLKPDCVHID